jgi:hypothetical protein
MMVCKAGACTYLFSFHSTDSLGHVAIHHWPNQETSWLVGFRDAGALDKIPLDPKSADEKPDVQEAEALNASGDLSGWRNEFTCEDRERSFDSSRSDYLGITPLGLPAGLVLGFG